MARRSRSELAIPLRPTANQNVGIGRNGPRVGICELDDEAVACELVGKLCGDQARPRSAREHHEDALARVVRVVTRVGPAGARAGAAQRATRREPAAGHDDRPERGGFQRRSPRDGQTPGT